MYSPYRAFHVRPYIPDLPVNPPELSDEEWERNNRNSMRNDAINALATAIDRLDELEHDGHHRHAQKYLESLRDYLGRDLED
jgi:hypothetical protein